MTVIKAKHYSETEKKLARSAVVIHMAVDIKDQDMAQFRHDDGTPRFEFMQAANAQFDALVAANPEASRGVADMPKHIGAVATAVLMVADVYNDVIPVEDLF